MLGCYLGTRNSEWLDGTSLALCIGLTGGNTDVKVNNDRMPITVETHDAACNRNCLKTNTAQKVQRRMMRAHASTNGYFGGYIAKRQPCGRFEAKKCIDKMWVVSLTLHRNVKKRSKKKREIVQLIIKMNNLSEI